MKLNIISIKDEIFKVGLNVLTYLRGRLEMEYETLAKRDEGLTQLPEGHELGGAP